MKEDKTRVIFVDCMEFMKYIPDGKKISNV